MSILRNRVRGFLNRGRPLLSEMCLAELNVLTAKHSLAPNRVNGRERQILSQGKALGSEVGFTLLEIATVIVILGILASLCFPVVRGFKGRSEGLKCASNLKGLGVGVQAYMNDYGHWPQIANTERGRGLNSAPVSESAQNLAKQWIETLKPYGIGETTWHCPSVENQIRQQGKKEALAAARIDYTPTVFDSKQDSPTLWPKHPWFVEKGALHGTGPNVLFADGSVSNMLELMKTVQ